MKPEVVLQIIVEQYEQYKKSVDMEASRKQELPIRSLDGFMCWISLTLEVNVEQDENGHDLQCSSGVSYPCDCWRKEALNTSAKEAIK